MLWEPLRSGCRMSAIREASGGEEQPVSQRHSSVRWDKGRRVAVSEDIYTQLTPGVGQ